MALIRPARWHTKLPVRFPHVVLACFIQFLQQPTTFSYTSLTNDLSNGSTVCCSVWGTKCILIYNMKASFRSQGSPRGISLVDKVALGQFSFSLYFGFTPTVSFHQSPIMIYFFISLHSYHKDRREKPWDSRTEQLIGCRGTLERKVLSNV